VSGIGQQRRTGITDEGDLPAFTKFGDDVVNGIVIRVFVQEQQWFFEIQRPQEALTFLFLFTHDGIGRAQGFDRTQGDVVRIPDRSGYDEERSARSHKVTMSLLEGSGLGSRPDIVDSCRRVYRRYPSDAGSGLSIPAIERNLTGATVTKDTKRAGTTCKKKSDAPGVGHPIL